MTPEVKKELEDLKDILMLPLVTEELVGLALSLAYSAGYKAGAAEVQAIAETHLVKLENQIKARA